MFVHYFSLQNNLLYSFNKKQSLIISPSSNVFTPPFFIIFNFCFLFWTYKYLTFFVNFVNIFVCKYEFLFTFINIDKKERKNVFFPFFAPFFRHFYVLFISGCGTVPVWYCTPSWKVCWNALHSDIQRSVQYFQRSCCCSLTGHVPFSFWLFWQYPRKSFRIFLWYI